VLGKGKMSEEEMSGSGGGAGQFVDKRGDGVREARCDKAVSLRAFARP